MYSKALHDRLREIRSLDVLKLLRRTALLGVGAEGGSEEDAPGGGPDAPAPRGTPRTAAQRLVVDNSWLFDNFAAPGAACAAVKQARAAIGAVVDTGAALRRRSAPRGGRPAPALPRVR